MMLVNAAAKAPRTSVAAEVFCKCRAVQKIVGGGKPWRKRLDTHLVWEEIVLTPNRVSQVYLTESVHKVVLQKSILAQIRQLNL